MESFIRTSYGTVERYRDGLLVIRLSDQVVLNDWVVSSLMDALLPLVHEPPTFVIAILSEATEFDMSLMERDHFARNNWATRLGAMALVVGDTALFHLFNLYFAYYPQPFPLKVCHELQDAIIWIDDKARSASVA